MKFSLLFTAFFLLLSFNIHSQWLPQISGTTEGLADVYFSDDHTGWAISMYGKILKTTDKGINWKSHISGTNTYFSCIYFTDNQYGWAAGDSSIIIKTSDGGVTWNYINRLPLPYSITARNDITSIHFTDQNTGWAVQNVYTTTPYSILYKTTDGGQTWTHNHSLMDIRSHSVFFLNSLHGWMTIGAFTDRTTDGGNTWAYPLESNNQTLFPSPYSTSIHFVNESRGWMIVKNYNQSLQPCGSLIKTTTDGGITWDICHSDTGVTYYDVYFINENSGWCAGEKGSIIYTADGGVNWTKQETGTNVYLSAIRFVSPLEGWAVGGSGLILHTINAGTPVELSAFTAECIEQSVILKWTTASETNNKGFEVQRLSPGKEEWEPAGFIEGYGTTTEHKFYSFNEIISLQGIYKYRLKQIDFDGTYEYSKEIEIDAFPPDEYYMGQNFPNPFNGGTTIKYYLPENSFVNISIYNSLGELIEILINGEKEAGRHTINCHINDLTSGIYFYKISAGKFTETKKMIYLK
jgi:photosystem II stability/assembly factor-like uncharacterized protein